MGVFKVLAGVALGVGAVAAAPFTGGGSLLGAATLVGSLAGTATVAGAVAAGATGAAAGYLLDKNSEEKEKAKITNARNEGIVAGKLLATEEYESNIKNLHNRLVQYNDYARNIVGLFAVGLAMANVDGSISPEEQEDLEPFITGIGGSSLPQDIKNEINNLRCNIPDFDKAISLAKKYGCKKQDIEDVMELIANSDGEIHWTEQEFIKKWHAQSSSYAIQ